MSEKIFIFGQSASGKSTIAGSVCLYFFEDPGMAVRVNPSNPEGTRYLIEKWITPLRSGQFPPFTRERIDRVDVGFEDKKGGAGITFFEIAGEKVRKLDPTRLDHGDLSDDVVECLEESTMILLVGSAEVSLPDHEEGDRYMLQMFLETLLQSENFSSIPIAFIISKWDQAESNSPEDFARTHYSEVVELLKFRFPDHALFVFSVGQVDENDGQKTLKHDFSRGTRKLAQWIAKVAARR